MSYQWHIKTVRVAVNIKILLIGEEKAVETDNITERLNTFTSLVLKDAEHKRDKLLKNVEDEYSNRMEDKETELLKVAYEGIQSSVREARQDAGARVLQTELEAKKKLILKREEIISDIMQLALERIQEFKNSADYEAWLVKTVKEAIDEVGDGAKTVFVAPDDMKYKEKLEAVQKGSITVEAADETDFIGGTRVYNIDRHVAADYSFKEMLDENKQVFLQSSGLALS